jgi:hypothetical protein
MPVQVTTIVIGVEDLARSKTFYREDPAARSRRAWRNR